MTDNNSADERIVDRRTVLKSAAATGAAATGLTALGGQAAAQDLNVNADGCSGAVSSSFRAST
jgi:hypothetical protein